MPHDELKPKDRVVLRMTRDGAVEENLTEGTSEKVSMRLEDAQLVAPHDMETGDLAEEVRKRRQLRPDELEDAESQAQSETQSADAAQEYKPAICPSAMIPHLTLCTLRHTAPIPLTTEKHLPIPLLPVRSADLVPNGRLTAKPVLERAAETSAEIPDLGSDAPAPRRIERLERISQKAHERLDAAVRNCPPKRF